LRGVHALAVLGGESGGFGVKYHDLHFVLRLDCCCDWIVVAIGVAVAIDVIDAIVIESNQFFLNMFSRLMNLKLCFIKQM
jgi:hypothetical protein